MKRYPLYTPVSDDMTLNGVNVMTDGETIQEYPDGRLTYGTFVLESIEYNCDQHQETLPPRPTAGFLAPIYGPFRLLDFQQIGTTTGVGQTPTIHIFRRRRACNGEAPCWLYDEEVGSDNAHNAALSA